MVNYFLQIDRLSHQKTTRITSRNTWEFKHNKLSEFLVSKETVVLRRWERSKQKFGFIKRFDKG